MNNKSFDNESEKKEEKNNNNNNNSPRTNINDFLPKNIIEEITETNNKAPNSSKNLTVFKNIDDDDDAQNLK